jgi:hypothetical protein
MSHVLKELLRRLNNVPLEAKDVKDAIRTRSVVLRERATNPMLQLKQCPIEELIKCIYCII